MRIFFWKKNREESSVKTPRSTDVQRAKERALHDQQSASRDLIETKAVAQRLRDQREANHFGPAIYDAMRPK